MTCEQWLNLCNVNSSLLSKSVERRPRIFGFPVRKTNTYPFWFMGKYAEHMCHVLIKEKLGKQLSQNVHNVNN